MVLNALLGIRHITGNKKVEVFKMGDINCFLEKGNSGYHVINDKWVSLRNAPNELRCHSEVREREDTQFNRGRLAAEATFSFVS